MKHKSIFPALITLFVFIMAVAHFGILSAPESPEAPAYGPSGELRSLLANKMQEGIDLKSTTDTTLANRFRLQYSIAAEEDGNTEFLAVDQLLKPVRTPVFDTILECYFNEELLFRDLSLKAMAAAADPDAGFWKYAGLESFSVDEFQSDEETLVCEFAFRGKHPGSTRWYQLSIDNRGNTRIHKA